MFPFRAQNQIRWVTFGITRLAAKGPAPTVSAVCVVSEVRAGRQGGRVFRMMALAVDGDMRGQGLASGAMARVEAYLLLGAGSRWRLTWLRA